jgi:phytanoyl-CoA hydroxylase
MGRKNDVFAKSSMRRHNAPNYFSTRVHFDRLFLRAGEEPPTAWAPIGDFV